MSQPEAKFKRKLIEAFEEVYPDKRNWSALVKGLNRDGVPDLVFHTPLAGARARTLWIEAKHADNPCSANQKLEMWRLRSLGVACGILRCPDISLPKPERAVYLQRVRAHDRQFSIDLLHYYRWEDLKTKVFWEALFAL